MATNITTAAVLAFENTNGLAEVFRPHQIYPNPFNPATTIAFSLPHSVSVSLIIYNLLGEEVTRLIVGRQNAGYHTIIWNGSANASGFYFYSLQAGDFIRTRKMVLLK